ncbi:hypothetical protein BO83DRAFT_378910 [Aspergillus eucalypticola CBS 122712]|uniref:Uncharacterized protein n=1 Tax=Aspergillus eucalypticola (strain CBS 122712 / IBT 29274) TaxID=1448314 RepID=A0A317VFN3_ASPEC|nr:uncharacterized protein BO83DRAFT_378910 [Aspergillus eucalypticola CBS 122712]PWY71927.1 hypothetical protein BO83DRAFT_378910 [Aspergillus eucalypticola CBS 122712]
MASILRQIVAGPRLQHPEAGLDLCYVTDNSKATNPIILLLLTHSLLLRTFSHRNLRALLQLPATRLQKPPGRARQVPRLET